MLLWVAGSTWIGCWNGRSWDDGDFYDDLGDATHWQPLPASPDGKAFQPMGSAERSVAHSPNIKAPDREGEQDG